MRAGERGQALGLALVVLAVVSLVASALVTSAWDATSSAYEAVRRGQAHQAAASAAELTSEVLRRIMTGPVVQNISSLGCRRQSESGARCVEPGLDGGLASGLRKSRIEQLARRSQEGWEALQEAFVEALRGYPCPARGDRSGVAAGVRASRDFPHRRGAPDAGG